MTFFVPREKLGQWKNVIDWNEKPPHSVMAAMIKLKHGEKYKKLRFPDDILNFLKELRSFFPDVPFEKFKDHVFTIVFGFSTKKDWNCVLSEWKETEKPINGEAVLENVWEEEKGKVAKVIENVEI